MFLVGTIYVYEATNFGSETGPIFDGGCHFYINYLIFSVLCV